MKYEYKIFNFELKNADEKTGAIEGYASTFGNTDLGGDIVDKGAFKKSIRESKGRLPILADHMPDRLLGWNTEMEEDDKGLLVKGQLNMDVQLARERWSLAKQALDVGADMGLSIGYTTIKAEPDRENPTVRHIKEVRLWEYSLVTFPMNTAAMLTAAKSYRLHEKEYKVKMLVEELKSLGLTDLEIKSALAPQAAAKEYDPALVSQSLSRLIKNLKGE